GAAAPDHRRRRRHLRGDGRRHPFRNESADRLRRAGRPPVKTSPQTLAWRALAGARVIQTPTRQRLPPGFQRAEFLLEHGFLDKIVHRREMRATLAQLVRLLGPPAAARRAET